MAFRNKGPVELNARPIGCCCWYMLQPLIELCRRYCSPFTRFDSPFTHPLARATAGLEGERSGGDHAAVDHAAMGHGAMAMGDDAQDDVEHVCDDAAEADEGTRLPRR